MFWLQVMSKVVRFASPGNEVVIALVGPLLVFDVAYEQIQAELAINLSSNVRGFFFFF